MNNITLESKLVRTEQETKIRTLNYGHKGKNTK